MQMIIIWIMIFLLFIVIFALLYFQRFTKIDRERWQKPKIHSDDGKAFLQDDDELMKSAND